MKVITSQCYRESQFVVVAQFPTSIFGNSTSRMLLLELALRPDLTPEDLERFAKGWREMPETMGLDDQIIVGPKDEA